MRKQRASYAACLHVLCVCEHTSTTGDPLRLEMMSSWDVSWAHARLLEWGWAVRRVPAVPQQGWHGNGIGDALLPQIIPCQLSTPPCHSYCHGMPCKEREDFPAFGVPACTSGCCHFWPYLWQSASPLVLSTPGGCPMYFAWGEGFRAEGFPSREGLSPGKSPPPRCPHLLQELCWRKQRSRKDTLLQKKNLKLLLMVFN